MYNKLNFLIIFVSIFYLTAFSIDEETFVKEALENSIIQDTLDSNFSVFDINSDNVFSANELKNVIANDKNKEKLAEYFTLSDKNNDNQLNKEEFGIFDKYHTELLFRENFKKKDRNNDGIYDEKDIPSIDESLNKLKEMTVNLENSVKQLESLNTENFAEDMIKSVGSAIADEDYYQMDKDKDNCVTNEEYATYQFKKNKDQDFSMSYDEYLKAFYIIDKKDENCLSKEEYIDDINKSMSFNDDYNTDFSNIAKGEYYEIDKNNDNCVNKEEYATYHTEYMQKFYTEHSMLEIFSYDETYNDSLEEYISIKKTDNNCLTKDEFVTYYAEELKKEEESFNKE